MSNKRKVGAGVGVLLERDGQILFGLRNSDPEKASSKLHGEGTWTLPGGSIDFQETFERAACREVEEETGIKIDQNSLQIVSVCNEIVEDAHYVTIGLKADHFEGDAETLEPEEIIEWRWFPKDQLPSPMYTPSNNMMHRYLAGKVYLPSA